MRPAAAAVRSEDWSKFCLPGPLELLLLLTDAAYTACVGELCPGTSFRINTLWVGTLFAHVDRIASGNRMPVTRYSEQPRGKVYM